MFQFATHFCTLVYLVREANRYSPPHDDKAANLDSAFKPSLLNSTVYIISIGLQISTFAVNYKVSLNHILKIGHSFHLFYLTYYIIKGHPFMESLRQNKPLLWSIFISLFAVVTLVTGLFSNLATQFSIVEFPLDVSKIV